MRCLAYIKVIVLPLPLLQAAIYQSINSCHPNSSQREVASLLSLLAYGMCEDLSHAWYEVGELSSWLIVGVLVLLTSISNMYHGIIPLIHPTETKVRLFQLSGRFNAAISLLSTSLCGALVPWGVYKAISKAPTTCVDRPRAHIMMSTFLSSTAILALYILCIQIPCREGA